MHITQEMADILTLRYPVGENTTKFWPGSRESTTQLMDFLAERGVSVEDYNMAMNAEAYASYDRKRKNSLNEREIFADPQDELERRAKWMASLKSQVTRYRPAVEQAPILVWVLGFTNMEELFEAFGFSTELPPGHREALELFSQLEQKDLELITEAAKTLLGEWVKDPPQLPNERIKLLYHLDRDRFPAEATRNNASMRLANRSTPEEITEFYIANAARLSYMRYPMVPLNALYCFAGTLNVSPRWLACYNDHDSWFGYAPDVERLYDLWTLQQYQIYRYPGSNYMTGTVSLKPVQPDPTGTIEPRKREIARLDYSRTLLTDMAKAFTDACREKEGAQR